MKRFTIPGYLSRKTVLTGLVAAAVALAVLGTLSLSFRVLRLQRTVTLLSEGLSSEIERQNQLTQFLESNQRTATDQLTEMRSLLNLPVATFRFPGQDAQRKAEDDPTFPFIRALDRLVLHHEQQEMRRTVSTLLSDRGSLAPLLRERGLSVRQSQSGGPGTWEITPRDPRSDGAPYFVLRLSGNAPPAVLELETLSGVVERMAYTNDSEDFSARLAEVVSRLTPEVVDYAQRYDTARAQLLAAADSRQVRAALDTKDLVIQPSPQDYPLVLSVLTSRGERLLTAELVRESLDVRIGERLIPAEESRHLEDQLAEHVSALDPYGEESRREEDPLRQVLEVARNEAFLQHLNRWGLTLDTAPRETLDFHLFELTNSSGKLLGSIGVLNNSGQLYLLDEEDVMITGLRTLSSVPEEVLRPRISSREESRTLPEEFPPGFRGGGARGGTDILLVGAHENKADAIMLLHLSPERTISMISIPRDIYYQGRKLSYHYEVYGARTFVRRVSDIIDRPIEGYVVIDMYAFIEVVNILGGITLTLNEPLVDPTYQIRDDGRWGTLNYPAGTHRLNGIEALRIARSRATTTDFGRSSRQQEILEALRRQINQLHAGNLDQLYQLFRALYEYVDTDLNAWELTQYFLAYRNAPIANRTGITFDNVLYATWSNLHNRGITHEDVAEVENFFYGEWILLPRNDDWTIIPWFVDRNLHS